jgi:hypothetical protein
LTLHASRNRARQSECGDDVDAIRFFVSVPPWISVNN